MLIGVIIRVIFSPDQGHFGVMIRVILPAIRVIRVTLDGRPLSLDVLPFSWKTSGNWRCHWVFAERRASMAIRLFLLVLLVTILGALVVVVILVVGEFVSAVL